MNNYSFFLLLKISAIGCSLAVGFNSWFLYKRLYRCHTTLDGFNFDNGNVERKNNPSLEEFCSEYDGKKPV